VIVKKLALRNDVYIIFKVGKDEFLFKKLHLCSNKVTDIKKFNSIYAAQKYMFETALKDIQAKKVVDNYRNVH
jgi:hypothetical protein